MVEWYDKRSQIISMKRSELDSTIISMFPCDEEGSVRVLELDSGMGQLTEKTLGTFPYAVVTCVEGASEMRSVAKERLREYGTRVAFQQLDFEDPSWHHSAEISSCRVRPSYTLPIRQKQKGSFQASLRCTRDNRLLHKRRFDQV
jgi:hypothetical protein